VELPPTAQRVLAAARQIVLDEGFSRLTLSRIAKVSGEKNTAAVKYYFGNKAGLVHVLLDTVIYDVIGQLDVPEHEVRAGTPGEALAQEERILSQPSDALRIWYDLLPHATREPELLERIRTSYERFIELHEEQVAAAVGVASTGPGERRLAALLSALSDGIALQALIGPRHFDMDEVLATLQVLLDHGLPALRDQPMGTATTER